MKNYEKNYEKGLAQLREMLKRARQKALQPPPDIGPYEPQPEQDEK